MPYLFKRWTAFNYLGGFRNSHLLEDKVINLGYHCIQSTTFTIPRFSDQEFAEKAAAEEFAQHLMNSIKSLQLVENTALDNNIELLRCDRTWLETAKDNVSFQLMSKIGLVLFIYLLILIMLPS